MPGVMVMKCTQGNWLFYEELPEGILYTVTNKEGDVVRTGELKLTIKAFIDSMKNAGYFPLKAGDLK